MTRVVITSDLHLGITKREEIEPLVEAIAVERPDLTVLAGDIGEGITEIRACLDLFRGLPGDIGAIAGNHDVWALSAPWKLGGVSSQEMWEQALPQAVREAGMLWLEDDVWRRDGLAVACSVAWYDYTGAADDIPPQPESFWVETKQRMHPDAKFINWPWSDVAFATRCGDGLMERVGRLEADPDVTNLLVVTHVPVFREQLIIKPDIPNWGYGNAFFGNLTLGARLREVGKLRAVVSGHTHIGRVVDTARDGGAALPAWVIASDFHTPRYVVYEHPGGALTTGGL